MCPGLGAAEGPTMGFSGSSSKWELSTSIPGCEDSIRGKEITVSFLSFPRHVSTFNGCLGERQSSSDI